MTLRHSISAMSSSDSLTLNIHPWIKQRVVSYHTAKVIAHKANCVPKLVAMATSLSTSGPHLTHDSYGHSDPTTQTASPLVPPFSHRGPHSVLYFTIGRPFPPQKCPFPWGICTSISPLPSNRHHPSSGDCLEGKGENYQVCSVQYCVQQLCTVRCTHI